VLYIEFDCKRDRIVASFFCDECHSKLGECLYPRWLLWKFIPSAVSDSLFALGVRLYALVKGMSCSPRREDDLVVAAVHVKCRLCRRGADAVGTAS